jgi:hypothetical protein
MSTPTTRQEFKDYCLRQLGFPVIDINVDDDQVDDRIDEALQYFRDYHFDGVEKIYMRYKLTQADIDRHWIYVPSAVIGITSVWPFDDSNSTVNMFDLRYQLRLHDLYDFTSVSYVPYEITMQHIRTIQLLFTGTPQFRYNRHMGKLYIDLDWLRFVKEDSWIVVECYRQLEPDLITLDGTANVSSSSNNVVGTGTYFYKDFVVGDELVINSEARRIVNIDSDVSINVSNAYSMTSNNNTIVKTGLSSVWNDRFLKRYGTALIKRQWGNNLKKFAGIQMPGGVSLNGQQIYDEADAEIKMIEEDMQVLNVLPPEILIG